MNPQFVSILGNDFRPRPATDFTGIPSVQEVRVGIDVHELSEIIFQDGFE